ncbi:hypothetical protein N8I77_001573 [Diaporthe amygdali]|uniref:Uncharacterized protein n=1 Tax=Phomopsis amygdali TaxID=1214568 RepID=A0AAD9SR66_PHOAM|nr:hypothetical protein N8I77_001573 [Diaporthe amygdali]
MAKETNTNPTVRILVIGTAGAGKNCLESRFTTSQYPPPYDPSLTLCSRRFLTLEPKPSSGGDSRSSALPALRVSTDFRESTPSLLSPPDSAGPASPISDPVSPISFVSTTSTLNTSTTSIPGSASFGREIGLPKSQPCIKCERRANTYLVEVVNYPALQSAKMRQHVYTKGEYDAVLLVYDVSDRNSFEKIQELHAEVPLGSDHGSKHHKRQRSHISRRHSGPPTEALQRRNSAMSFFNAGGGLVGVEEEVEAKKGSRGVVVALIGNKADVDDEDCDQTEKTIEEDGSQEQDYDDDCESALAVFGDALQRDPRDEVRFGATSSVLGITSRPKPSRAESSETVERWLQIVGRAVEEGKEGAHDVLAVPKPPASKSKPGRLVSKAEGEDLARSLQLQVPFLETSARTGANVDEAFESVVRSVLGRNHTHSTTELAKRCRERHEAEQQKRAGVSRAPKPGDRTTSSAGPGRAQEHHGRLALETKLDRHGHTAHLERPAPVQHVPSRENVTRRESFMGRMRRMLMHEEPRERENIRGSRDNSPIRSL